MILILVIFSLCISILLLNKKRLFSKSHYCTYFSKALFTFFILAFILAMISQPKVVYEGAVTGLDTWLKIVFPSLLPFFIASELLVSFGVVHFMGILLEPVMRPIFNLPGAGSFVLAIGFTSGFPIGAMVTAKIRKQHLCTRVEAERLICFTNNSSPLFMLVAVAVGMFQHPELGIVIAGAHYLASLTLGICLRFYGRKDQEVITRNNYRKNIIKRAFQQMFAIQKQETRPLGKILGDSVKNSIGNLLNIGGFIILFAVIIRLLTNAEIISGISQLLGHILIPLGMSPDLLKSLSSGFFEMTIGTKLASETQAPLIQKTIAVAMILGWSGLSIHAQVASMIADTDIRILPYMLSRFAHAGLAALFTYLFIGPAYTTLAVFSKPVFGAIGQQALNSPLMTPVFSLILFITAIILIVCIMVLLLLIKDIKRLIWK